MELHCLQFNLLHLRSIELISVELGRFLPAEGLTPTPAGAQNAYDTEKGSEGLSTEPLPPPPGLTLNCHRVAARDKSQAPKDSNGGLWQLQNGSCGSLLRWMPSYSKLAANCSLLVWVRQLFLPWINSVCACKEWKQAGRSPSPEIRAPLCTHPARHNPALKSFQSKHTKGERGSDISSRTRHTISRSPESWPSDLSTRQQPPHCLVPDDGL